MAETCPIVAFKNVFYDDSTVLHKDWENIMMRNLPMTWAALNIALAGALTWVLIESEALGSTAVLFVQ